MIFKEGKLRALAVARKNGNIAEATRLAGLFLARDGSIPRQSVESVNRFTKRNPELGTSAGIMIAIVSARRKLGTRPK